MLYGLYGRRSPEALEARSLWCRSDSAPPKTEETRTSCAFWWPTRPTWKQGPGFCRGSPQLLSVFVCLYTDAAAGIYTPLSRHSRAAKTAGYPRLKCFVTGGRRSLLRGTVGISFDLDVLFVIVFDDDGCISPARSRSHVYGGSIPSATPRVLNVLHAQPATTELHLFIFVKRLAWRIPKIFVDWL